MENENQELRRKLDDELTKTFEMQREYSSFQQKALGDSSELQSQLKIKSFEYTSLAMKYEEIMHQSREQKLKLEVQAEEINALKSTLMKCEGDYRVKEINFHREDQVLRQRLAILEEFVEKNNIDIGLTGNSFHRSSRKQEMEKLEEENFQSKQSCISLQKEKENLEKEVLKLKKDLSMISQPTNFFLEKIKALEQEKRDILHSKVCLEDQIEVFHRENQEKTCQLKDLQGRLLEILRRRQEIFELHHMMEGKIKPMESK